MGILTIRGSASRTAMMSTKINMIENDMGSIYLTSFGTRMREDSGAAI